MPAVSIILPLYNGQPFIRHTISRIRSQTFQDWELLIINDGSADQGEAAAVQEAQTDRRIRVFGKPNGGISSARNYGISKAAGTYIVFADQDDTAGRNWLTALVNGMAGNVDLAVGGKILTVIDASGKAVKSRVCRYEDTLLETEEERYGFLFNQENDASSQHVWNCMYKKELIDAHSIRFDEHLAMGMEDVLFNICYGYYCSKIRKIPQVVYSYRQRAEGICAQNADHRAAVWISRPKRSFDATESPNERPCKPDAAGNPNAKPCIPDVWRLCTA